MAKWILGLPGGPAGPFYSIVDQNGMVIVLQAGSKEIAEQIIREHEAAQPQRALDGARFCPACHALLEEGSVYCDTCGTDTPRP